MPTSKQHSPRRRNVATEYSYRRPLRLHEILPAIGIGIGAGFFAFYVTRLLIQRTPLRVDHVVGAGRSLLATRSPERTSRP